MARNSEIVPTVIQRPPLATQLSTDQTPNHPPMLMITNVTARAAPKILMPRASGCSSRKAIQALAASVSANAANGAAQDTRSAIVSAWIGSGFMVCCNATHVRDAGLAPQSDHWRRTATAVIRPATISKPPATNQAVSSTVPRRTSRAGSMVMTALPGMNDAAVRVARALRRRGSRSVSPGF
jgi:hypothetical protein